MLSRGRRRKKQAIGSKSSTKDFGWLEGKEDAFLTRCSNSEGSNKSIRGSGRKRKCPVTNDNPNHLNSNQCETVERKPSNALPYLLHLREIGVERAHRPIATRILFRETNNTSWKSVLLRKPAQISSYSSDQDAKENEWVDYSPPIYNSQGNYKSTLHKQVWRKKRVIPFSKLKTPVSDAILGIDRSGEFLIGIGSSDSSSSDDLRNDCNVKLLLKFYGEIPSNLFLRADGNI